MQIDVRVKQRYDAFWKGQSIDRCCMFITAPKQDTDRSVVEETISARERWTNIAWRVRKTLREIENTDYLGEAFPYAVSNMGPGCITACIGGSCQWADDTVWFENEPFFITDWENPSAPEFDKSSEMFLLLDQLVRAYLEAGKDKFYTSMPTIGGVLDTIAALRGTQNLLMDLYEYPQEIKDYVKLLDSVWIEFCKAFSHRLIRHQGMMISWIPDYSEIPFVPLQCDFSAMISPEMFKEFVMPDLIYQTEHMERSLYHWDGPGEIPHLPHLLSLDRLNAIQWTPGAGNEDVTDERWYENYQRIQGSGKSLILLGADPDGVEKLLKSISTRGLFLSVNVSERKRAEELLKIADSIGVK